MKFIILVFFLLPLSFLQALELSPDLLKWANENPIITMGIEDDFPPFNYVDEKGEPTGVGELIRHKLSAILPVKLQVTSKGSFATQLKKLAEKQIAMISVCAASPERAKTMLFSKPFLSLTPIIVTNKKSGYQNMADIPRSARIAVPYGYASVSSALRIVDQDKIVRVNSTFIGLEMVEADKIDGFVTYLSAKSYAMQLHGFTHLQALPVVGVKPTPLGFCIDKDQPELVVLLDAGIEALGSDYFNQLQAEWIASLNNTDIKSTHESISLPKIVVISIVVLIFLIYLMQRYSSVLSQKFETVKFKIIYFSILIMMLLSAFWVLETYFENFRLRIVEDQKESFNITQKATIKSLDEWYFPRLASIQELVRAPLFQPSVEKLVVAYQSNDTQVYAQQTDWLDDFFHSRPYSTAKGRQYTILSYDGVALLSSEGRNGLKSAIPKRYPVLFEQAREGLSVFIPTVDVGEGADFPVVSIIEPIFGDDGNVIAMLMGSFDVRQGFSSRFKGVRLGLTGESYALNQQGFLLSESRFIAQLHKDKILLFGQSAIFKMNVAKYKDNPIIDDARFKTAGRNLVGYTDYMGHTVVGQWSWVERYHFMLVSELSVDEMYLEYTELRHILFITMVAFIALITAISLFMMIISHRAHQMNRLSQEKLEGLVEKRTEALQLSEAKNSLIVDSVADGILGLDALGGIVFFNRAAEHILGYKETDVLNRNYQEILYFCDSVRADKKLLKMQIQQGLSESKNVYVETDYFCHADAIEIPVSYHLSIITEKNSPFKAVLTFQDISQRLLESERTRTLLASLPIAIFLINMDKKIIEINTATERLLGYSKEEIINKYLSYFIPKHRQQAHQKVMEYFFETSKFVGIGQAAIQTKSGKTIEVKVVCSMVELNAEQMVVLSVLDITEENQTKKLLIEAKEFADEASRSKSNFLANMSHEIRTPMNAIIGMSQLALHGELGAKERNYVTKVNSAANNLLGIINDILDFSKIEAGKLELDNHSFAFSELLDNFSTIIGLKTQEKRVELLFNIDHDVPLFFTGDLLRLNQILINLGGNAIKFTEVGEIILNVSISEVDGDRIKLLFSIKDSGIGIKSEQLKKLFIAFSQADASTTRKYGGTGLGLSISKHLVELMQGDIWAESVDGLGSEFFFTSWLTVDKSDKSLQMRETVQVRLSGKRVLIVDDSLITLASLKEVIEGFGCQVFTAQSGAQALTIAEKTSHFDFALIDWDMPMMNGLETCDALQQMPGVVIEHFILISAYGREQIRESDYIKRVDSLLSKPITAQRLHQTLQSSLGYKLESDTPRDQVINKQPSLVGIHLLLVEDNELNQELATALLQAEGMIVSHATHGEMAVSMVQDNNYDCILMDIQMPVMDGYKATELIREFNQEIPILAMTANAMSGEKSKVITAGMNDYISKPINVETMFSVINHWIKVKSKKTRLPASIDNSSSAMKVEQLFVHFSAIDKQAGLAICNESHELYLKILTKFEFTNQQFHQHFITQWQAESWNDLTRLVHSLKGGAGNIGAKTLYAQLNDLELACLKPEHDIEIQPLLDRVTSEFSTVNEEITTMLLLPYKQHKHNDSETPLLTELEIASKLNELQRLVDEFDTGAQEFATVLERGVVDHQAKKMLIHFIEQLDNFDFDSADQILSQLKSIT
ncbi:response regulator [Psychromonas hadalis]|uniref:response regulator n=1 Tax=Psychromonas hadalis TaxID=211669 RepID=UPI0003B2F928|nr:response regulator [Psychromonas hadalis]